MGERVSKGGVPTPPAVDEVLALDDGALAAFLIGAMSAGHPTHDNFAALGEVIRIGAIAKPDALASALRRRRR